MYMYGNNIYNQSYLLLIPAILLTLYAQARVKGAYAKYAQIGNTRRITGAQAADIIIRRNGLGIGIQEVAGTLTDNYNPQTRILSLSQGVYSSYSVAAIAIAAHECGHACQHAQGYALLRLRNNLVPVLNITSSLSWPVMILGLLMGSGGNLIFNIGLAMFMLVVIFHLITLPVELDASRRALDMLQEYGIVNGQTEEIAGAREVLSAAALTYLAALAMAVGNLLRILAMRGSNRR